MRSAFSAPKELENLMGVGGKLDDIGVLL